MKYITTRRMKQLDHIAIERYGIPSLILMENAGRGIADLAAAVIAGEAKQSQRLLRRRFETPPRNDGRGYRILVVSGKGNNGGDGLVSARHLANRGYRVNVVLLSNPSDLKDDPKVNYQILKKMRLPVEFLTTERNLARLRFLIRKSDLILDGVFGVGLTRPVRGFFYDVISVLNDSKKKILAIDIPSGLNSDSGKMLGIAVRARATGTLGARKRGLLVADGPACAGKITVIDISIPRELISQ